MEKSKPVEAELIPSVDSILRLGTNEAMLNRLVQQKVAEIMAERDAMIFEPVFRSRQIAYELKRLQNVPEQRKWSISLERYGCMICETRERIHAGNGMCNRCHALWFRRLTQIVSEGVSGRPALAAHGTTWEQRLLPATGARDGAHQTWYHRSNAKDQALYQRVATKLGVTRAYVRQVALGARHSESVLVALKEESKQTL